MPAVGAMPATAHNTCLAGAIASRASVALVVGALGAVTIERPESLDDGWDGGSRPEVWGQGSGWVVRGER